MGFFRSRKTVAPPPPEEEPEPRNAGGLASRLNVKEIDLYPIAVKLLWHYYDPADQGKPEGSAREFPGPIDETVDDSVKELERVHLLEVVPTFSDFGITAKLTHAGLVLMGAQGAPGNLAPTEVTDPTTGAVTVYRAVNLGL